MPLSILKAVAFSVVQVRVEEEPDVTEVGSAASVQASTGEGGGVTVTVTLAAHCTEPPGPVAVPVYVVVTAGATDVEPDSTGVTEPTPLSILKSAAFAVVHESVEAEPPTTEVGDAESVQTGAGGGMTTIVSMGGGMLAPVSVVTGGVLASPPTAVPMSVNASPPTAVPISPTVNASPPTAVPMSVKASPPTAVPISPTKPLASPPTAVPISPAKAPASPPTAAPMSPPKSPLKNSPSARACKGVNKGSWCISDKVKPRESAKIIKISVRAIECRMGMRICSYFRGTSEEMFRKREPLERTCTFQRSEPAALRGDADREELACQDLAFVEPDARPDVIPDS
ncbi:MAG: hypothetical protein UY97_C0025G0006 [Parcubacteria group bacterium GW2011_GWB1_57_6]|nr:MAG: hypothetical protein UY97_C0025G0006 [Parcubacteria group bacterium GW2011_GWB1_57_6]